MNARATFTVVAALAVAAAGPSAADTIARGEVVKVEAGEIYVNLGEKAGVQEGSRLRLKRPIKLRNPVTRRWVQDWLPVGAADVTFVGDQLSMAVLDEDLLAAVKAGDVAEIYVEREEASARPPPPRKKAPPPPKPDPEPQPDLVDAEPLPAVDPDTALVLETWRAQRAGSVDARIAAWEGYLAANASSPYAETVRDDLAILRGVRDEITLPTVAEPRAVGGVQHDAPTRAAPGARVPLVFVLESPDRVASAWLHYRTAGTETYRRLLLVREDDRYLRGEIPGAVVTAPGVEYFLEVVDPAGDAGLAVPETTIAVDHTGVTDHFTPRDPRTRVSTSAIWLDFATFDHRPGQHTDRFYQLEIDATYRLDGALAGLSTGFGILDGKGGFIDRPGRDTGYQYGYAEAEVRLMDKLGAAVRLIAGVDLDALGLGVEGRIRVGDLDGTHLSFTASQIARIGYLSDIRFQAHAAPRVPVGVSVGVTDRPDNGDVAVRLGVDVGLRALSWLEPTLRLSYQGRSVEHSGIGAGLGLNFHW